MQSLTVGYSNQTSSLSGGGVWVYLFVGLQIAEKDERRKKVAKLITRRGNLVLAFNFLINKIIV